MFASVSVLNLFFFVEGGDIQAVFNKKYMFFELIKLNEIVSQGGVILDSRDFQQ